MSSPHFRTSPAPAREAATCMCVFGSDCSSFAPGHALHLIQARIASATPSGWTDAIVESSDAHEGALVVRTLAADEILHLWNGAGAAAIVEPGTPVAVHARYDVLAVGRRQFNVLRG